MMKRLNIVLIIRANFSHLCVSLISLSKILSLQKKEIEFSNIYIVILYRIWKKNHIIKKRVSA